MKHNMGVDIWIRNLNSHPDGRTHAEGSLKQGQQQIILGL